MAFAPAVAEEAGFGIGLFGTLFAILGLLCIRFAWAMTFGALFFTAARLLSPLRRVTIPFTHVGLGVIPDFFVAADNFVYRAIGKGITANEHAWHKLLLWNAYVLTATGDEIASLSYDTAAALGLVHAKVSPARIQALTKPVIANYVSTLPAVKVITKPAAKTAVDHYPALAARVAKLEHEIAVPVKAALPRPQARAVAPAKAIAAPLPVTLPRAGTSVKTLERETTALQKWVKAHAHLLTIGGITGLVSAVLFRRLGLGWLKCRGVNKVGRALCGATGLIETLFSDAIEALIVTDLCRFVNAMSYAARKFQPVLIAFVDLEDALIGCDGASKPEPLGTPTLSLPAVSGLVTS